MNGYTTRIGMTVTMEIVYLITFALSADLRTVSLDLAAGFHQSAQIGSRIQINIQSVLQGIQIRGRLHQYQESVTNSSVLRHRKWLWLPE